MTITLDKILAAKRKEIEIIDRPSTRALYGRVLAQSERSFYDAITRENPSLSIIAEFKRGSPSRGVIYPDAKVTEVVPIYQREGAAAISVLTDRHFHGTLDDFGMARRATNLPLLRKDFILSDIQVLQSRANGADAILLMVSILTDDRLKTYRELAESLGMSALVEVHTRDEMRRAEQSGAKIIGINNRNLTDNGYVTDINTTLRLRPYTPPGIPIVTESGIETYDHVKQLHREPVRAMLVGGSLMETKSLEGITRQMRALQGRE